ncbi:MAG: capsular biosynthesis protein [Lachnospira sp.]|nr:capsular biosynthesis protein [Lachnospira sp.]
MNSIGMFDMHNHILFGVDDGAKTIEDSLALIKVAYNDGIRGLVLTPHFHPKRGMAHYAEVVENFNELVDVVEERIPDMQLYLGREVYYRSDILETKGSFDKYLMSGTACMLVEFSTTVEENYIKNAVSNLLFEGYQPIVAHVERYACAVKNKKLVDELKSIGAYIQINADSVLGKTGFAVKQAVKYYLKNGLVDFISSDAHDLKTRKPELAAAYAYVAKKFGEDYAGLLFRENAIAMLNGEL